MSLRLWHLIRTRRSGTRRSRPSRALSTVTVAPAMRLHVRRITIPTLPFVEPRKSSPTAASLTFAAAKLRCATRGARFVLEGSDQVVSCSCRCGERVGWARTRALALYVGSLSYVVPTLVARKDKNAWARRTRGHSSRRVV